MIFHFVLFLFLGSKFLTPEVVAKPRDALVFGVSCEADENYRFRSLRRAYVSCPRQKTSLTSSLRHFHHITGVSKFFHINVDLLMHQKLNFGLIN